MPVDWRDVGLHCLVAVFFVSLSVTIMLWIHMPLILLAALCANTIGWPAREAWQRARKGHDDPWRFSYHKRWEAYAPVVTGWLIGGPALWLG